MKALTLTGRYAWCLRGAERFAEPVPARGALGLWDWERPASALALAGGS